MAKVSSEYWSYDDPRWANDPAYGNPETMKYVGPWEQVLQATGFRGKVYEPMIEMQPDPNGGFMPLEVGQQYTPQAKAAIDSLRASGYDLRWKHPDKRTFNTYWGFVTPDGVQDIKIEGSDLGDMIMPLVKTWGAGLGLANLGAGINSLLGNVGTGAALPFESIGGEVLSAADLATLPSDVLGQTTFPSPAEAVDLSTGGGLRTPISTGSVYELAPATSGGGTGLQPYKNFLGGADLTPIDIAPNVGTSLGATTSALDAGLAAAGSAAGSLAGAGATGGVAGGGAVAPTVADVAATGATGAATGGGLSSADKAALYGSEGYGAGMTGAQTSAYDTVLGATGSKTAADIASTVTGAGGSLLDKAVQLVTSPVGQAVVGGVGSIVGGVLEANAAEKAAQTQADAAANALALQREMFEYQKSLLEPYRTAGTKALERLSGAMGLGGPGSQQQMLEMDPGYGFRLGEGLKALERMQASRGNFLSGGALKAGQRFAQDTASQEYGNAYNRLANIAGLGQTAGTQMGGAAAGFGTSAGNIMGQEANALAAGRLGRTSAYTGALGGALNSFQNYLNRQQEERLVRDIFGRTTVGG